MSQAGRLSFLLFLTCLLVLSSPCGCHPWTPGSTRSTLRTHSNHTAGKGSTIVAEVAGYADVAKQIIDLAVFGAAQNRSYTRLAHFTDTIGNRVSGSHSLQMAIKYMYNAMAQDGLDVHLEPVKIPHWVRGKESAEMIAPRAKGLAMLGLSSSVGTPPEGIEAEVLVVQSFEELKLRASEAMARIVVFNQPFVSYGETVAYRAYGASEAAKVGAVGTLIRSITPFSINSPHTGLLHYQDGVKRIPSACITVEDAELMWRMAQKGQKIVVRLTMAAKTLPDADSFNTVAEIRGWQHPEQVVLLSGHLDSWDVGQGAMDDGGGVMISWEVLSLIKDLGLRPRRTLRTVLWTAEEQGGVGAQQCYDLHKVNMSNFDLVMESDLGTFTPVALQFTGSDAAQKVMSEVVKLLAPINTTKLEAHGEGTDISPWMQAGVPGASLHVADSRYFWFHHSEGDTMTVQDPRDMNLCSALWAVVAYVVADLQDMLPRMFCKKVFKKNQSFNDDFSRSVLSAVMLLIVDNRVTGKKRKMKPPIHGKENENRIMQTGMESSKVIQMSGSKDNQSFWGTMLYNAVDTKWDLSLPNEQMSQHPGGGGDVGDVRVSQSV